MASYKALYGEKMSDSSLMGWSWWHEPH
jgi:hypothetical protein